MFWGSKALKAKGVSFGVWKQWVLLFTKNNKNYYCTHLSTYPVNQQRTSSRTPEHWLHQHSAPLETWKQMHELNKNAERRFLTGLQRGYFFWREGAAIHTQATIKPCRQPLHATESHVRLKHKLIQNIVPFWKTCVTKKKEYHF